MVKPAEILRWTARIWSLASLAFVTAFALGSGGIPSPSEAVALAFFPGGVAAGLIIGWRRERLGGALAILSLAVFYLWSAMRNGLLPRGPWFFLVAAPGLLFLLTPLLERRRRPQGS